MTHRLLVADRGDGPAGARVLAGRPAGPEYARSGTAAFVYHHPRVHLAAVALQTTIDVYNVLWDSLSAGAVIQLLPMVLVVFVLQRHIARGLALGAVK